MENKYILLIDFRCFGEPTVETPAGYSSSAFERVEPHVGREGRHQHPGLMHNLVLLCRQTG